MSRTIHLHPILQNTLHLRPAPSFIGDYTTSEIYTLKWIIEVIVLLVFFCLNNCITCYENMSRYLIVNPIKILLRILNRFWY